MDDTFVARQLEDLLVKADELGAYNKAQRTVISALQLQVQAEVDVMRAHDVEIAVTRDACTIAAVVAINS